MARFGLLTFHLRPCHRLHRRVVGMVRQIQEQLFPVTAAQKSRPSGHCNGQSTSGVQAVNTPPKASFTRLSPRESGEARIFT